MFSEQRALLRGCQGEVLSWGWRRHQLSLGSSGQDALRSPVVENPDLGIQAGPYAGH